jgi:uncharacterized lipoprotein YddW (UPF0748 family)
MFNKILLQATVGCLVLVFAGCGGSKKTVKDAAPAAAPAATGQQPTVTITTANDPVATDPAPAEKVADVVPAKTNAPKAMAEFRAAWVASVSNINWPSRRGLSTEAQQREAIQLLDFLKSHHFNAVIFQVRPQADAFYQSSLEPWSYFLTGKQGQAPNPYYDPLQFWIDAAHDRGIELHVWLNPYRAHGRKTERWPLVVRSC